MIGVSGQLEMYSGQQSDQGPGPNSGNEFLEGNWDSVTMHQKMGYNSGQFGFQAYPMELEERQGLYRSSNGTFCQNIQMSDDHSSGVKRRKGIDDCIALLNPSAGSRIQNAGDQQKEVSSQPVGISVVEGNLKGSSKMQSKEDSSDGDGTKEDYAHVWAKRGQATNSHSLAERLRRKKISERMKLLQDLVPGCSKVNSSCFGTGNFSGTILCCVTYRHPRQITGKAVMLDEIINYVQSLQRQVEFLSMKLATVNPELGFDIQQILSKQMMLSQERHLAFYGIDPEPSTLVAHFNQGTMLPEMMCNVSNPVDVFQGTTAHDISIVNQMHAMWDGLENIPHMSFNPGATADSSTSNAGSMKIEK
ncbi:hypothetical protein GUJ93_ZPchr0003g16789 [Zizania palustris]|uniref:BHLH domain-containing protein n=1 Tax=Zizania palustris TaxID=103762 RepID=A0A8J5SFV2_ZIZPA|nr:hypothetical protein GUJ93_ZPchr0003g16789 [Zizania palustris]KAG8062452.1 hypothetical protein GUJ93_ZPchr0003g16789 [Zizania palustris]